MSIFEGIPRTVPITVQIFLLYEITLLFTVSFKWNIMIKWWVFNNVDGDSSERISILKYQQYFMHLIAINLYFTKWQFIYNLW
jgi:hypothetical protein